MQDDIDLAIRYGTPPDSAMVARPLLPNRRMVCVAPDCAARVGVPQTPEQLANLPTLVLLNAAGPMNEWRYRAGGTPKAVRVSHYQQSDDGEIIRKWALLGRGYAYKSLLDIRADLQAGRLITVFHRKRAAQRAVSPQQLPAAAGQATDRVSAGALQIR